MGYYIYRLIDHTERDPFINMALDEAIAMACRNSLVPPTIRFHTWDSPVLSVGRFQKIERDINIEMCNKLGIDIVRRISGGKTVYHKDELTYSVISKKSDNIYSKDRYSSQRIIAAALIAGLKRIGVYAEIVQPVKDRGDIRDMPYCFLSASQNEIVFKGKKLVGSAQKRWRDIFLQQGSILIDFSPQETLSLINFPAEDIREKRIRDAEGKITSLNRILSIYIQVNEIKDALVRGFREVFGIRIEEGHIIQYERELSMKLAESEKYSPLQRM
ncbi:MAG: biotin/lipoate A/B protein ligase family protein [Nitrospirota bacterium]